MPPPPPCLCVNIFPAGLTSHKDSVYVRGGSWLPIWIHGAVYLWPRWPTTAPSPPCGAPPPPPPALINEKKMLSPLMRVIWSEKTSSLCFFSLFAALRRQLASCSVVKTDASMILTRLKGATRTYLCLCADWMSHRATICWFILELRLTKQRLWTFQNQNVVNSSIIQTDSRGTFEEILTRRSRDIRFKKLGQTDGQADKTSGND